MFGGRKRFGDLQTRRDGGERCSSVNGFVFDGEGQSKKSDTGAEGGRQHEAEEDAKEHQRNLSKRSVSCCRNRANRRLRSCEWLRFVLARSAVVESRRFFRGECPCSDRRWW